MRPIERAVPLALSVAAALMAAAPVLAAVSPSAVPTTSTGVPAGHADLSSPAGMAMDDTQLFGRVLLDQLEWRHDGSEDTGAWEIEGWYGGDRDKVWVRTEGEQTDSYTQNARGELLWDRAIGRWWSLQAGVREDFASGPPRTWAALGIQGLAPYWFDVEATLYAGDAGRTAARLKAEHDILLTQRLILQPEAELNFYGKRDPARRLDSGLADAEVGLRLRYEIRREFAPYIGVAWTREARLLPGAGLGPDGRPAAPRAQIASQVQLVAGVRAWF